MPRTTTIFSAGAKVDFPAVRKAMDDIGYYGWIHIEAPNPTGADPQLP